MLLDFVDFVTWLMKFTLNLDLKLRFISLTVSLVTSWRTADFSPSISCKKAFLRYGFVLIGNFDNAFLYFGSLRHPWQSVGECSVFLSCSRLVQEPEGNMDKTDFFPQKTWFFQWFFGICWRMLCNCWYHFGNSRGNVLGIFRIVFLSILRCQKFLLPYCWTTKSLVNTS